MGSIAVVDYGMGNLRSVAKALEHVAPDSRVLVTSDAAAIAAADRVVFPGVGAMPDCIRELDERNLRQAVVQAAAEKPFLGICLGMQALFGASEEGNVDGLSILPGTVRRFPAEAMVDAKGERLKVPHIGWNEVHQAVSHPLWQGITNGARFYFVHSYYVEAGNPELVAAFTHYPFAFACAVARNNIFAVQFHPEKSQAAGLKLLANFAAWNGQAS
jgi:glutamine amidotransferase